MSSDELRELTLLYVVNALDEDERRVIDQRLSRGCPETIGALAEARAVLNHLPTLETPISPSPQARERLRSRIERQQSTEARSPAADSAVRTVPEPKSASGRPADAIPSGRALQSPAKRRYSIAIAAIISMILTGGLIAILVVPAMFDQRGQLLSLQEIVKQMKEDMTAYVDDLNRLQERDQVREAMDQLLSSPALKVISLRALENANDENRGWLYWDPESNRCRIYAEHFERPEGGRYRLALVTEDDQEILGATFTFDDSGRSFFDITLPENDIDSPNHFASVRVLHDDSEEGDETDDVLGRPIFGGSFH
ncbi:MAG: hypothetical protein EA377_09715 [Phycisphaerales bacterium]|nr:MAG: hypothetical protein EA377_09715 [Phycisphaerales bacterium]